MGLPSAFQPRNAFVLAMALIAANLACGNRADDGAHPPSECPSGTCQQTFEVRATLLGDGKGRVVSSPNGIDCPGLCVAVFPAGSNVTFSWVPAENSDFLGWSGEGCSGVGTCAITVDAPKLVSASQTLVRMLFLSPRNVDRTDSGNTNFANNVWGTNIDGAGLTRLTGGVAFTPLFFNAEWSPDRTRIAFQATVETNGFGLRSDIWRVNADSTGLTQLTHGQTPGADSISPHWSPDGSQIVFTSRLGLDGVGSSKTSNIWSVKPDGTGLVPLTTDLDPISNQEPQWSPDGGHILFASTRSVEGIAPADPFAPLNLWRMKPDGSEKVPLTKATAMNAGSDSGTWSADGKAIFFVSMLNIKGDADNQNGLSENIWRINPDGSGMVPVTQTTASGAYSRKYQLSPDGFRIAFESLRNIDGSDSANPTWNIWSVRTDGTGLLPLTNATAPFAESFQPRWSPDGTEIAFVSVRNVDGTDSINPNGTANIWRVGPDGTGLLPLTRGTAPSANSTNPQWSPAGTQIVFESLLNIDGTYTVQPNFTSNIWRVKPNGTGLVPVTRMTARFAGCSNLQLR